jgi:hypothetical protein
MIHKRLPASEHCLYCLTVPAIDASYSVLPTAAPPAFRTLTALQRRTHTFCYRPVKAVCSLSAELHVSVHRVAS